VLYSYFSSFFRSQINSAQNSKAQNQTTNDDASNSGAPVVFVVLDDWPELPHSKNNNDLINFTFIGPNISNFLGNRKYFLLHFGIVVLLCFLTNFLC
jgi:hypothetical protein